MYYNFNDYLSLINDLRVKEFYIFSSHLFYPSHQHSCCYLGGQSAVREYTLLRIKVILKNHFNLVYCSQTNGFMAVPIFSSYEDPSLIEVSIFNDYEGLQSKQ